MEEYRELYFRGSSEQLFEFVNQIGKYALGDWKFEKPSSDYEDYLFFDYFGEIVDKARVSIHVGNDIKNGELKVGCIIPAKKENSVSTNIMRY